MAPFPLVLADITSVDPLQLITLGGAAGAFFMVLKWITDGKLHTDSEVIGLRQDKADLLKLNADQAKALSTSNELLVKSTELIVGLRDDNAKLQAENDRMEARLERARGS